MGADGASFSDIGSDIGQTPKSLLLESVEERPARGLLANSISNAVVKLFSEFLGRGPTKARTVVSRDLISVVLEDTLTRAERHLIEGGQGDTVMEMRRAMQGTMRQPLIEAIEYLSQRRVIAFTSDQQLVPDFTVENFVLEPLPHDSDGHGRDGHLDG